MKYEIFLDAIASREPALLVLHDGFKGNFLKSTPQTCKSSLGSTSSISRIIIGQENS